MRLSVLGLVEPQQRASPTTAPTPRAEHRPPTVGVVSRLVARQRTLGAPQRREVPRAVVHPRPRMCVAAGGKPAHRPVGRIPLAVLPVAQRHTALAVPQRGPCSGSPGPPSPRVITDLPAQVTRQSRISRACVRTGSGSFPGRERLSPSFLRIGRKVAVGRARSFAELPLSFAYGGKLQGYASSAPHREISG
jgi:hypothetical protein